MEFAFNQKLAEAVREFSETLKTDRKKASDFKQHPTETIKEILTEKKITVPRPELFHAHAINVGEALPAEPEKATIDRYIYVFRESGLFEFKVVPGSPDGNDDVMERPMACCCCACCVLELR